MLRGALRDIQKTAARETNEYQEKKLRYPVDSELSVGWCYPTFEQPGLAAFS